MGNVLPDSRISLLNDNILILIKFQEQIKGFFERIALTQLKITKEKYNDDTRSLNIYEIADYLTSKANQIEKEISDTIGSLQSILDDYEMAISATLAWHPPEVSIA